VPTLVFLATRTDAIVDDMQTFGESGQGGPAPGRGSRLALEGASAVVRGPGPTLRRSTEFAAGAIIAGKYRVERVIGEGAMGIVLAAQHLELEEPVAIKCIRPAMHGLPDIVSRFAREAKACARLQSEHVAKVLDVGIAPPIGPYMVMEYLEGEDLAAVLQKGGPLWVRKAAEYVMQVCEALALAHAASITHRDVKPENLFLTRRGNLEIIKVLDFGISKAPPGGRLFGGEVSMAETQSLMGTPLYMSPEQIRATHDVDHRTDIWSLGVVLYELLTGRPVFSGETVTQVCARVLEATPPNLSEHCKGAPRELGRVVTRCLMKNPVDRYQSAAELANALLPFAPSRARLHAERANSVLRGHGSMPDSQPPPSRLPLVTTTAPTVFGAEPSQAPAHKASRAVFAVVASLFALGLGFVAVRSVRLSPSSIANTGQGASVAAGHAFAPERRVALPPVPVVALPGPSVKPETKATARVTRARRTRPVPAARADRSPTMAEAVSPAPGAQNSGPPPSLEEPTKEAQPRARLLDARRVRRLD
jgi:eukaryotic-like serine/threonine-protein kinase